MTPQDRHPLVYCVVLHLGLQPDGSARRLLAETLDSIRQMTYPNFRIIVVDNGSTDGSQEMIRSRYPAIELIENGENLGFGGGNNVGMEHALGKGADWILLLNNDIVVDREMLTELMATGAADEHVGVLCPKIYYHAEPDRLWYAGGKVNFWTGIISHRGIRETDHGQYDTIEQVGYVTGCAFLVRRDALVQVGLFDPVYHPAYPEDADLTERVRRAGYTLVYVPRAKLWHKVSSFSGGGMTPFKTKLKVEHNLIYFKRYARWYHWLTIPWCVGGMAVVFVLREFLRGNFRVLQALLRGFGKAAGRLLSPGNR